VHTDSVDGLNHVHPAVAVATIVAVVLMLAVPRNRVVLPFLSAALLIPMDQLVILGPFHLQILRILMLAGWMRCGGAAFQTLSRTFNAIDGLVLCFAFVDAIDYVILWDGSTESIVNRCGAVYTVLGLYFLLRLLIQDDQDVGAAIKVLAYVAAVIAIVMIVERASGTNPYSWLGGDRAWTRQVVAAREGKLRAMGPFQHPILAGCFGGVILPMFLGQWLRSRRDRRTAVIGAVSATVIAFASSSSTPIMAWAAGAAGVAMWPARRVTRAMRWAMVLGLVTLHLAMKAPVWSLIQRVDLMGGSSGFHRFYLVDQTIRHFWDWCLIGVQSTDKWGPFMWDHANQYVAVAVTSGLAPLVLFIAIIVQAIKFAGRARKRAEGDRRRALFPWALGAGVVANVVAFFGISYYDQTILAWFALLCMISATWASQRRTVLPRPDSANSTYITEDAEISMAQMPASAENQVEYRKYV
jgi:hypothetical protein